MLFWNGGFAMFHVQNSTCIRNISIASVYPMRNIFVFSFRVDIIFTHVRYKRIGSLFLFSSLIPRKFALLFTHFRSFLLILNIYISPDAGGIFIVWNWSRVALTARYNFIITLSPYCKYIPEIFLRTFSELLHNLVSITFSRDYYIFNSA